MCFIKNIKCSGQQRPDGTCARHLALQLIHLIQTGLSGEDALSEPLLRKENWEKALGFYIRQQLD